MSVPSEGLERDVLVPARIDDCRLPLGFRRAQTADLSDWPAGRSDLTVFLTGIRSILEAARDVMPTSGASHNDSPEAGATQTVVKVRELSVVVLPFTNLSPDPDNAYFADGLTDELITDLSKIESLRVISRTSAMSFKETQKDVGTIARELNVRYVLEGSVRRVQNTLRITAQLIDADTDSHLWAEKYAGTLDDVFDLQEQLSRQIVDGLKLKLTADEERQLVGRPIQNVKAYEYYLRARTNIYSFDGPLIERAISDLKTALDILGDNVLLFRALGMALWHLRNLGISEDPDVLDKVRECANRIREQDPNDAGSYLLMGITQWTSGDCRGAVIQLREAYRRDRSDPDTPFYLVAASLTTGQMDFAGDLIRKLHRVDPLRPECVLLVGLHHFFEGRFEDAAKFQERSLQLGPDSVMSRWAAVRTFISAGEPSRAEACASYFDSLDPRPLLMEAAYIFVTGLSEKADDMPEVNVTVRTMAGQNAEHAQYLSDVYAFGGDEKKALEWLEIALRNGFMNYAYLSQHNSFIAEFRDSSEWRDVLQRVKEQQQEFESRLLPLS